MTANTEDQRKFRVVQTADRVAVIITPRGVRAEDGVELLDFNPTFASLLDSNGVVFDGYANALASTIGGLSYSRLREALSSTEMVGFVDQTRSFWDRGLRQGELYEDAPFTLSLSQATRALADKIPRHHRSGHVMSLADDAALLTLLSVKGAPEGPEIHFSALAVAMVPDRLVAHVPESEVASLVHRTQLRSLPDAPPRLVQKACLVEVKTPRVEALFGRTVGLGCYVYEPGKYVILGIDYPRGVHVAVWEPRWAEGEIAEGVAVDLDHPYTRVPDELRAEHRAWAKEAARFLVVLGVMLDTANAPVAVSDESSRSAEEREHDRRRAKKGGPAQKTQKTPRTWVTRTVSLSASARRSMSPPPSPGRASANADGADGTKGKLAQEHTLVSGHFKRVPTGPGGTKREWRWVDTYEARRWIAPAPLKVLVTS